MERRSPFLSVIGLAVAFVPLAAFAGSVTTAPVAQPAPAVGAPILVLLAIALAGAAAADAELQSLCANTIQIIAIDGICDMVDSLVSSLRECAVGQTLQNGESCVLLRCV